MVHPMLTIIPEIDAATRGRIADSIKLTGLDNRIVMFDEMILDGRGRYDACKIANVEPRFVKLEEIDSGVAEENDPAKKNTIAFRWMIR